MSLLSNSRYQPAVRLGNWFEDICLERDKLRVFRDLRDRGELLVEKGRKLFSNFHKDITLEASKENIRFGAVVQLMPYQLPLCEYNTPNIRTALSVSPNEHVLRHSQHISDECEISLAPSLKACARNSFRIVGSDAKQRSDEFLKYGQRFRLECVETSADPLLLFSAPKSANLSNIITSSFNSTKYGELNLKVGLCLKRNCGPGNQVPSAYANWFCQHVDPSQRFETEGSPLPSNAAVVVTHAATNRNMAAENVVVQTLFGPEFLVSVQNYKNIYKRESWQNIWTIATGH